MQDGSFKVKKSGKQMGPLAPPFLCVKELRDFHLDLVHRLSTLPGSW